MVLYFRVAMLMLGVDVKVWCFVSHVSLGATGVFSEVETDRYHQPVTLALGVIEVRSLALAANGGKL